MTTIATGSAPNGPHDVDRLHDGRAARDGVLGDHDPVAGLEGAGHPAHDAVVLGLLADAEAPQRPAPRGRHRGDAERHGIGAHREAADGVDVGGHDRERGVGHEQDAVGPARRLLRVEEPGAGAARLQRELARCAASAPGRDGVGRRGPPPERSVARMQLRIFTEPQQGASYDDLLAVARATEELGFDAFFRSDHFLKMGDVSGLPGPTDAWITLAGLARDTSTDPARARWSRRPRSGCPDRSPSRVAQVDQMSGGRVELGLGAGWYEAEHKAYAIEFPPLGERFERLEEQLAIITGLWATPEGEQFELRRPPLHRRATPRHCPSPYSSRLPIIVGGGGPKRTPRLAATYAAEFNLPFAPLDEFTAQTERVRQACEAIGRDPATMTFSAALVLCCGRDEAEVAGGPPPSAASPTSCARTAPPARPTRWSPRCSAGPRPGPTRVYLQVLDLHDLEHLQLIAEAVAPSVA